jgi:hypothetical protein
MSIRATVRVTGAAKNTVTKLLADLGQACVEHQDAVMVNLPSTRVECDEIWSYCYSKQRNVPEEHQRGSMTGLPVKVTELLVSVEDPNGLVGALGPPLDG